MNVPLQLKQITQHTTQVAFSTSFFLGGCVAAGREEENHEPIDVDAGDDVVVEAVQYGRAEAASHQYHQPDAPVVMPLGLEDAPTSRPPSAAMSAPREPKEKRGKLQARKRTAPVLEDPADDAVVEVLRSKPIIVVEEEAAEEKKSDEPVRAEKKKTARDPVSESFLRTQGSSSTYQAPSSSSTRY